MRLGLAIALEGQKPARGGEMDLETFDVEVQELPISRDASLVVPLVQEQYALTDELVRDPELVDLVLGIGAGTARLHRGPRADVAQGAQLVQEVLGHGGSLGGIDRSLAIELLSQSASPSLHQLPLRIGQVPDLHGVRVQ